MIVHCDKEDCEEEIMTLTQTDSRQEWIEETYECPKCGAIKIHRIEFDQLGLVIDDKIMEG